MLSPCWDLRLLAVWDVVETQKTLLESLDTLDFLFNLILLFGSIVWDVKERWCVSVCVCVCERERECECVCVCVCVRERVRTCLPI